MPAHEKNTQSYLELAIDGALPTSTEALHVGRPNIMGKEKFLTSVASILENQRLTNNGPYVQKFEQEIAARLGVKHCVAMCNGTIALEIAIRALGVVENYRELMRAAAR